MPLRICYLTAEMAPFAKAGGLADVAAALLKYLTGAGHDLRLFMPAYSTIDRTGLEMHAVDYLQQMQVKIGEHETAFSVMQARARGD